jgi:hypothetical protein
MAIKKQEFYEGAALHLIARTGQIRSVRYDAPFFLLNDRITVLFKYSTKNRSPWGFTFTEDEQRQLSSQPTQHQIVIGLICGSDGIAALSFESYLTIAPMRDSAIHVSCYRDHGEHYEIGGPDGSLKRKIAPSSWQRILDDRATRQ